MASGARSVVNLVNADGRTALHMAAISGDSNCTKILLKNGADVTTSNYTDSNALDYASKKGYANCV